MQGFNINLDLTDYYDDLRKFSCVYVDLGKCKYIGDIEKHIKLLFGLKNDICLINEKFLLPGFEDVQVCYQCRTIKVQDRHFNEVKPCNIEENLSVNQSALNLIQTEKTVDLSCKPKQRLNVSLNKTPDNVLDESPQYFENNNQLKESYCVNLTNSLTSSKEKHKKKKKRTKRDCDEGNGSNILDMSLNKVRKYSHDNCFLPSSDCSSKELIESKKWFYEEKDQKSQSKLRKKILKPSSVNREPSVFSSIEYPLESNESISKTITNKCNGLESQYSVLKRFDKNNTNCETIFQDQYDDILEINNKVLHKKSCEKSQSKSVNSETLLKERKKECQNHIDTLLGSTRVINSTPSKNVENLNSNFVTDLQENVNDLQNNPLSNNCSENETSQTGDSTKQAFSESSNTRFKRKRKRKHKKNKQNLYLHAVGPVLQNLEVKDHQFTTLTLNSNNQRSATAKHIYFEDEDDDFTGEKFFDTTISSCSETSVQGSCETEKVNSLNGSKDQESSCNVIPKWQEEILKLTKAPKPLKVERFPKLTIKSPQSNAHSQEHTLKSESNNTEQKNEGSNHFTSVQTRAGYEAQVCNKEDKCNANENHCKPELNILSEKLQDSLMPLTRDLQNIVLSNYPVIDKVISDDIIIFQVLKLNELNEPDISKRILAKVKNVTNFPGQILLHIIEGLEECGESSRTDINNEEDTVEYKWTDLIEPRLLYP